MQKLGKKTKSVMRKSIFIVLVVLLSTSLIFSGAFANKNCATSCCCKKMVNAVHHAPEKQLRSAMDCCSGMPINPCDFESGQTFVLPAYTLVSTGGDPSNPSVPAWVLTTSVIDPKNSKNLHLDHFIRETSQDPPLYLQKRSFLN